MIDRRSALALATGAIALAVPGLSVAQDWKAKYPEIVLAIVPAENAGGVVDRFTPFANTWKRNSAPRSRCASPTTTPPSSKA